jgi:hypothetical protein
MPPKQDAWPARNEPRPPVRAGTCAIVALRHSAPDCVVTPLQTPLRVKDPVQLNWFLGDI